jgi:HAD superfamily hydrolase (TIGR01509 family)
MEGRPRERRQSASASPGSDVERLIGDGSPWQKAFDEYRLTQAGEMAHEGPLSRDRDEGRRRGMRDLGSNIRRNSAWTLADARVVTPASLMAFDFVLWDHDGVIVDTEPWFFKATRRTLRDFGVQLSHGQWLTLQAAGRGLEEFATKAAATPLDFREIRRVRDDLYARLLRENDVMIEGASEVLGQVAARCRMAMVTTSLRRFVDQIHVDTSVLERFDHIISAEDCTRHKPDPQPYQLAMEVLGATPGRSIAVEDSLRGFTSARAAGLRCIVIRSEFMTGYEFDGAHAVLDDIRELPSALAE